jgi:hypothetical protein
MQHDIAPLVYLLGYQVLCEKYAMRCHYDYEPMEYDGGGYTFTQIKMNNMNCLSAFSIISRTLTAIYIS